MLYRRILFEAMEKVARGEDPMGVIRDPARNQPMIEIPREREGYQSFRVDPTSTDPVGKAEFEPLPV
jgi:hypothetical protein